MRLDRYYLKNFRRLEDVEVHLSNKETLFVGPNNSGKTSAATAFRLFITRERNFKIYDFSAPLIKQINDFVDKKESEEKTLPEITIDLWFSVDPDTEYGRVARFLPTVSEDFSEIGVRISFSIKDSQELIRAYEKDCPQKSEGRKQLSEFLAEGSRLLSFFSLKYFMLESKGAPFSKKEVEAHPLDEKDGRKSLDSLLKVDFVDAQRNIDDLEAVKSNRLSRVLAEFYKHNLEQSENDAEAIAIVDRSNQDLTKHYEEQFKGLVGIINDLGFPNANDRNLKILSNLNPEAALKGNTTLLYQDNESGHTLPEAYNGLGFKNLIYIAIQVSHFQKQWLCTQENRPLCQIIFIEEPEVHLHAQVQQTFIRQINKVTQRTANENEGKNNPLPQLVISTHSSHILNEAELANVKYFQRCNTQHSSFGKSPKKVASKILDLKSFRPTKKPEENLKFLKRFLKLTHCDLFFTDAAVLVEGTVEKLLLPEFITNEAKELESKYLTVLEVGGAYAHKIVPLVEYIGLPSLIITDLDSIDPIANRSTCRADKENAKTSNKTISELLKKDKIQDLLKINDKDKIIESESSKKYIAFQGEVEVEGYGKDKRMIPRTFEEAFIYENLKLAKEKKLEVFVEFPSTSTYEGDYQVIYETVKNKNYKKVEFALSQIDTDEKWKTPAYIKNGLAWLVAELKDDREGM